MSEPTPTPEGTIPAPEAPAPLQPGTPEYDTAMAARGVAATQEVPAKFRQADGTVDMAAFTQSYAELERQFHAPKAEEAVAPTAEVPAEVPVPEAPTPETLQVPEPEVEAEVPADDAAPQGVSEEQWGMWKGEIMRNGDVSAESREAIKAKLGLNDNIVNDFVEAHKAHMRAGMTKAAGVVGGEDKLSKIFSWASNEANFTADARAQVNEGLRGDAWEVTLRGLEAQYNSAQSSRPKAAEMTHKPTVSNPAGRDTVSGFGSVQEFSSWRADPRYGRDARYTDQVNSRASMTDWTRIR